MNWLDLLKQLGPLVLAATPLAPIAPYVIAGIEAAEHLHTATGPQKLAESKKIVQATIGAVNAAHGSEVISPAKVDATFDSAVATTIQVINLVHAAG